MTGFSRTIICGHLGRDPEVRSTQDGRQIATLSVATSDSWVDKRTGERQEKTEWHRVVIFNDKLSEIAEKYLRKGSLVLVEGKNKTRKWVDKDGADRHTTEVVVEAFDGKLVMMSQKSDDGSHNNESRNTGHDRTSRGAGTDRTNAHRQVDDFDDEIPF